MITEKTTDENISHNPHCTVCVQDSQKEGLDSAPHLTAQPCTGEQLAIWNRLPHVSAQVDNNGWITNTVCHHNANRLRLNVLSMQVQSEMQ